MTAKSQCLCEQCKMTVIQCKERDKSSNRMLEKYLEWLQAMVDIANDTAKNQENWIEAAASSGRCVGLIQAKDKLVELW